MALSLPRPDHGALFVISGPSGVGKSTLIAHVREQVPHLGFAVSATTRPPRPGEVDGVDYHFLGREAFADRVAEGAFVEHAEVCGERYGTLRSSVTEAMAEGRSILLDIDAQGAAAVRKLAFLRAVDVFVLPPNLDELERRLRSRGTEDEAVVRRRMTDAAVQLAAAGDYGHLVVNDDLEAARAQLLAIVVAELSRRERHERVLSALLGQVERRRAHDDPS